MKKSIALFFFAFTVMTVSAQMQKADSISKEQMKKLAFMVGKWQGEGWMMGRGSKSEFTQTENIQFKLDSTAILVEGKGMSNGKVIHDALAIITYNKEKAQYSFRSYLPNGMNGEFKAELIDDKLYWYPNENVRYIIWLNDQKQWYERGEFKRGDSWMQFFEMTLDEQN